MLPIQLFYVILAICCLYAAVRGGAPERVGSAIFVGAASLSTAALSAPSARFGAVEIGVFAVDTAMLLALFALALFAERLWPLWVTALQLIGAAGHAVKLVDAGVLREAYAFAMAFWSYPMLSLLVFGTWNHQRRLAKFGVDKSWSSSSDRLDRRRPGGPIG
jgi:hypothetical protein